MFDLLLPETCLLCEQTGQSPCSTCASRLPPSRSTRLPNGVGRVVALTSYEGHGRRLVSELKYGNRRGALHWVAAQLAARVRSDCSNTSSDAAYATSYDSAYDSRSDYDAPSQYDCITWVPATSCGVRTRGYDLAKLLARRLGKELRIPVLCLIARDRGPGQTGRDSLARVSGPSLRPSAKLTGRYARKPGCARILVIDDVLTTGASLSGAAAVLRRSLTRRVDAAVIARTPVLFGASGSKTRR